MLDSGNVALLTILIGKAQLIEAYYKELYNLEMSGRKGSEEYKKLLKELENSVREEDKMYHILGSDKIESKCMNLLAYVESLLPESGEDKTDGEMLNRNYESIANQNYDNRILRRIRNELRKKGPISAVARKTDIGVAVQDTSKLCIEIEKDIYNGFLVFLQEEIDKSDDADFKGQLLRSKYNAAFIDKDVEADMIAADFSISKAFKSNSRIVAHKTGISPDVSITAENFLGYKIAQKHILEMLEISDIDYECPKSAITSILRQCFMKSAFSLMDIEGIMDLNSDFHDYIDSKEFKSKHPTDNTSSDLIISCFKSIKNNKGKRIVLLP